MNIKDVLALRGVEVPEVEDKLDFMFKRQREIIDGFNKIEARNKLLETADIPVNIDDPAGQARLKSFTWRIVEELAEAMGCLKNRPWKQTQLPTDKDHFYEELADALHFMLDLFILAGLDAEQLFALYFMKSEVNLFRQESGY